MDQPSFEDNPMIFFDEYETLDSENDAFSSLTSSPMTNSFEANETASRTKLGDTGLMTPNCSIDLGMLNRSFQKLDSGYVIIDVEPSMPSSAHGMKHSRSCESLTIYESLAENIPKVNLDKKHSKMSSQSGMKHQISLPAANLVPHLVQRYEALGPNASPRSIKALSFSGESDNGFDSLPQQDKQKMKASSLDYNDGVISFTTSMDSKKPRSFSAGVSDDPLYETACTYEKVSGYESVPASGSLASFLPTRNTSTSSR